jgi:signal transduction histidine kinase
MSSPCCVTGTVLIVDDNPTNLSVLSQTLRSVGLSVRIATDGESAIEQAKHKQPDLILLDVQMPGIDGFETCRQLKATASTQAIPIIFTTALANTESKNRGFALGAVDYIPKPFEQEEVVARVHLHLRLRQLTESLEQQVAERTAALEHAQVQLVQQEKLSTLGQLVAGVAHEMNNPIGCISNNIAPAQEYVTAIAQALKLYQAHCSNLSPDPQDEIEGLDLEFILEDLPKLLDSMRLSAERIRDISTSLRNFVRLDATKKQYTNLHQGLDSTLLILQHRIKASSERPAIEVIRHYGDIPEIECYPGQLNQVFMNILANAIDAIEDAWKQNKLNGHTPKITIATSKLSPTQVMIQITDNGTGMTDEVKQRVFNHLFTTKPVGQGTGLGLAIAQQIVVEKHQGNIEVESCLGQ